MGFLDTQYQLKYVNTKIKDLQFAAADIKRARVLIRVAYPDPAGFVCMSRIRIRYSKKIRFRSVFWKKSLPLIRIFRFEISFKLNFFIERSCITNITIKLTFKLISYFKKTTKGVFLVGSGSGLFFRGPDPVISKFRIRIQVIYNRIRNPGIDLVILDTEMSPANKIKVHLQGVILFLSVNY